AAAPAGSPVVAAAPVYSQTMRADTFLLAAVPPATTPLPSLPASTPAKLGVFESVAIAAARLPAASKWQAARQTDYAAMFGADCAASGLNGCDTRFATRIRDIANQVAGLSDREMLN